MTNEFINKIVGAFVVLLIGVVLLTSVSVETNNRTDLLSVVNDSINIGTAMDGTNMINESVGFSVTTQGDTTIDCPMTAITMSNSSGDQLLTTANYNFTAGSGAFTLVNTSILYSYLNQTNTTEINYTYCPDGYITLGWGRTTTSLVPGFFALALMGVALWMFYGIARDWMKT